LGLGRRGSPKGSMLVRKRGMTTSVMQGSKKVGEEVSAALRIVGKEIKPLQCASCEKKKSRRDRWRGGKRLEEKV